MLSWGVLTDYAIRYTMRALGLEPRTYGLKGRC